MDVFEALEEKRASKANEIRDAYADLVSAMVAGVEPEVDLIDETLEAAGKSVAELRKDVELRLYRQKLRELAKEAPAVRAELEKLQKELAALDAELRKAALDHQAKSLPIGARIAQLHAKEVEIMRVEGNLIESCGDEALKHRRKELMARTNAQPGSAFLKEPHVMEPFNRAVRELAEIEARMRDW